jgi:hypothetical protein
MSLVDASGDALPSSEPIRVALCVPCQDMVHAGWAFSFASMVGFTTYHFPAIELVSLQVKSTLLPDQRNSLVRRAQQHGATHILWMDADMTFPKDALVRLLDHDKDIVGTNYSTRRPPNIPTAEREGEGLIYITPGAAGLLEVSRMGFGLVLTKIGIYDTIEKPYFSLAYRPQFDDFTGEDVFFCRKAKEAGFTSFIDLQLSQQVGHLGEFRYTLEHSDAMRDVAAAEGRKMMDAGSPRGPLDSK